MSSVSAQPPPANSPVPADVMIAGRHIDHLLELVARATEPTAPVEDRESAAFELVGAMRYLLGTTHIPAATPVPARLDGDGAGSRVGAADGAATRSALEAEPSERENHRPRGDR